MSQNFSQDIYKKLLFDVKDQNTFLKLLDYKMVFSNKKFYQYRSFDENGYNLKNLKNNQIFLNSPQNFNDPFDCWLTANFQDYIRSEMLKNKDKVLLNINEKYNLSNTDKEEIIKYLESDDFLNSLNIKQILTKQCRYKELEQLNNKLQSIFKVSCFSVDSKNLLMWSHYAKNHQGFCVEYDISKITPQHTFRINFWPIIYRTKTLDIALLKEITKVIKNTPDLAPITRVIIGTIKPKDWSYEQEWRFILRHIDDDLFTMPVKPSCVYLGAKIEADNETQIIKILDEQNIPHKKMKLEPGYFALEAV